MFLVNAENFNVAFQRRIYLVYLILRLWFGLYDVNDLCVLCQTYNFMIIINVSASLLFYSLFVCFKVWWSCNVMLNVNLNLWLMSFIEFDLCAFDLWFVNFYWCDGFIKFVFMLSMCVNKDTCHEFFGLLLLLFYAVKV